MSAILPIERPVRRRTSQAYSVLYAKPRPIVVELVEGDMLRFHELGRRERWVLSVAEAFRHAVKESVG